MPERQPNFHGWATKTGIKCTDGRTIMENAFADQDGKKVPLVWQHMHDDPDYVLGHAILHNKKGGVYADCYLNDSPKAQQTKNLIENGDINSLSIYANQLKQDDRRNVMHGVIRELSVVLAGANMGATIDNVVLAHGEEMDELEDEAIVYSDESEKLLFLEHEDKEEEAKEMPKEELEHADEAPAKEKTVKDVWDSMTEEQQQVCYYMIGQALEGKDNDEGAGEAEHSDEDGDVLTMKTNVFDKETVRGGVLSHADKVAIMNRAKKLGTMSEAWEEAKETYEALRHDDASDAGSAVTSDVTPSGVYNDNGTLQTYGIGNIDYLFPDYQNINERPEMIKRDDEWVSVMMNGVTKRPFARIRTTNANITMDEARAKGYIKGNEKKEEVFNLLKRTVDPQTVYKKQKFDKDDLTDIDWDIIPWVKAEMRTMLNEEIARAILIGDGRDVEDEDKIKEDHIKPIWKDDDLYAIKVPVAVGTDDEATAKNAIRAAIKARKQYKGSGNLTLFTSEDWLSEMLLLEDGFGHSLYKTTQELATKMRVNRIVTVPQLEGLTRTVGNVTKKLIGIIVDLKDYSTGTNRRGQVEMFDDFDIDFNQYKYLIETRLSGMLTRPYSAMILETGNAAPTYTEAEPEGTENPKELGWFEKEGTVYRKSADATVVTGKTYYTRGAY